MIQMIFTILIIVVAVFFLLRRLYFVIFPKKNAGGITGCPGGCSTCSMHRRDTVGVVFKPLNTKPS